jgi:hypothetical protein
MMQQFLSLAEVERAIPNARTLVRHPMGATNFGAGTIKKFMLKLSKDPTVRQLSKQALVAGLNMADPTGTASAIAKTALAKAAVFGEGSSLPQRPTGFQFPVVTQLSGSESVSFETSLNDVVEGSGVSPVVEWSKAGVAGVPFEGESYTLAMACYEMRRAGAPVTKGVYTGQIDYFDVNPVGRWAELVILPVDCESAKTASTTKLRGVFATECVIGPRTYPDLPSDFFGPGVELTATPVSLANPYPSDARGWTVKVQW